MISQWGHSGGPDWVDGGRTHRGRKQQWKRGGTRSRTGCWEQIHSRPTLSLQHFLWQTLGQSRQLLFPTPYQVVQVALADQKGGFGADKAVVVLQLCFREVCAEDGVHHTLPALQVLLQLAGIVCLAEQQGALVLQAGLEEAHTIQIYILYSTGTTGRVLLDNIMNDNTLRQITPFRSQPNPSQQNCGQAWAKVFIWVSKRHA